MAEEIFQRPLLSFDMQGQSIKDVLLKGVKIEEVEILPSASENYNRIVFYNGEVMYSNGVKWIGQEDLVTAGLNITNVGDGKITINGTEYTIYTLPPITNAMQATMPTKTFKGNLSTSASTPSDLTTSQVANAIKNDLNLDIQLVQYNGYYILTQGGTEIGRIKIDRVVKSGKLVKGTWDNGVFTESTVGKEIALKLIIDTDDDSTEDNAIYLNVSDLFNVYEGYQSDTILIEIVEANKIKASVLDASIGWVHLDEEVTMSIQDLGLKITALERDNVNADWNETDSTKKSFIQNKPSLNQVTLGVIAGGTEVGAGRVYSPSNENIVVELSKVAQSGSYNDLTDKPPIPTIVDSLPETGVDGEQVILKDRTYTWYNGKWNCIADDLGGREETREEQFTFQPTANDESVKDGVAVVKSIKGNTVVANQFLQPSLFETQTINGVTLTNNGDGTYTLSGSPSDSGGFQATTYPRSEKDKYYLRGGYSSDLYVVFGRAQDSGSGAIGTSYTGGGNVSYFPRINFTKNLDLTTPIIIRPIVINLTQMFGEGNEPATVEEFERLYPNLPTEYNEGSLLNLNADSIKSVGFNQWDREWEYGFINTTTGIKIKYDGVSTPNISNHRFVCKNYIKVLSNTSYYVRAENLRTGDALYIYEYDANKKFIKYITVNSDTDIGNKVFTTSDSCRYILFQNYYESVDVDAYQNNICINLSHSGYRNGEYEPYKEFIANLPIKDYFPDGMKSAGSVRDEIVWDESIEKYKAIQRIGSIILDATNFNINYLSELGGFQIVTTSAGLPGSSGTFVGLMAKYPYKGKYDVIKDKELGWVYTRFPFVKDSSFNGDASAFKQSLQGQTLYYEHQTPIETIIEDFDLIDYEVSDFGTEEILSDESTTPIIADIQYGFNAVDEIRNHRFAIKDIKKQLQTIDSEIVEKLAPVAISGDYNDLENKPTISDSIITLKDGTGQNLGSFSLNQTNDTDFTFTRLATQYIKTDAFGLSGVVPATEHLCGSHPIVQAYLNGEFTLVKLVNDGYGNITWSSNVYITTDVKFTLIFLGVKIARTNVVPTSN